MKKKVKARKSKASRVNVVNAKMSPAAEKAARAKARQVAKGNLSLLIRHLLENYKPKRGEKIAFSKVT